MAEFVEKALEKLLPVFEQLKLIQLFSAKEVDDFICICRDFEYKLSKRTKLAKDFLAYATYLDEQLALIGRRRKEMKYAHRYDEIDRPLRNKCAFLYRICTQRFKKLEYFEREIAFLHRVNMFKSCSQAYTRLLQFYGHIPENHERACRYEYFDNNSAESARALVLTGLRKFPQFLPLWAAHFEIELRFVAQLLKRRNVFLADNGQVKKEDATLEQKETEDELFQLRVARIVYELAMKTVQNLAEKRKLLFQFLTIARDCGEFTRDLQVSLSEHLSALAWDSSEDEEAAHQIPDAELFEIDTKGSQAGPSKGKQENEKKSRKAILLDNFDRNDPELKEILSMAKLTEDFDQKPLDEVLLSSRRQEKKARKLERAKTAGCEWFALPATELDEERRRDLELLQMRDALDPKQHFKKPDREVLPKHFQIGQIVETKADFYSGRLARKQRKRTLAEELMADHEIIARNKKRYSEIVRQKEQAGRGSFRKAGALPRHSRRKDKKKSH